MDYGAVLKFDNYGFAILSESDTNSESEVQDQDERCHIYSPLPLTNSSIEQWKTLCAESSSTDLIKDRKTVCRLLKAGGHNPMRSEIWKLFLGISQTRSENKFNYKERIVDICFKLESYGISEISNECNIRKISSLLDGRSLNDVLSCKKEKENLGGEGKEAEREWDGELCEEDERMGVAEDDRAWLSIARQIMLDIIRTFPTHRLFSSETSTKVSLLRVLMMYSEYSPTIGYCQGMAYVAAILLMHMEKEEDVFWSIVTLFNSEKYLSGFYDAKLSRVQTCASVFSMMLKDRQPQLAQHLEVLSIHPLMYMTSWFMCLFSTLPCWDTVLAICDLVFLEGYQCLFRAGLAVLDVCSAELLAMNQMETVLPFIQKLPSRLTSFEVLIPVLWKTSVSRSEIEQYQDRVIQDSCEVLSSRVLKRCAPTGESSTPAKRRKTTGVPVAATPVTQSFLSRLLNAITPGSRLIQQPMNESALENGYLAGSQKRQTLTAKRKRRKRDGGRGGRTPVPQSCRELDVEVPVANVQTGRKRKRDDTGNCSFLNTHEIEMQEICTLSPTKQGRFSPSTNTYTPPLPLFLSPSPFSMSPFEINGGGIKETPCSVLANNSQVKLSFGHSSKQNCSRASPLRRSQRLAQKRDRSLEWRLSQAASFISPSDHPLQDILHTDACDSSERAAFNCFTITTPIRANQENKKRRLQEYEAELKREH